MQCTLLSITRHHRTGGSEHPLLCASELCVVCNMCAGGVLYDGRGTYNDVIGYAERLFSRIRQTVRRAVLSGVL